MARLAVLQRSWRPTSRVIRGWWEPTTTRARTNGSRRIPVSLDPKIKKHNCRTVEITGDGLLTELPSVVEATRCAIEMRRAIHKQNTGVKGLWARGEWAQD